MKREKKVNAVQQDEPGAEPSEFYRSVHTDQQYEVRKSGSGLEMKCISCKPIVIDGELKDHKWNPVQRDYLDRLLDFNSFVKE